MEEAKKYACDVENVVVVGDKKSANCRNLYKVVKEINPNSYFCDKVDILPSFSGDVFITGGASVAPWEIKEVAQIIAKENGAEVVYP